MFDEAAARVWCETLARSLRVERITRNGAPYLNRYYVVGGKPGAARGRSPAIFLHHFVASDAPTVVHSHPWGFSCSLIMAGGYREERCAADGTRLRRDFRPGDVNVLAPTDRHRVDLLAADCWTLFLAGPIVHRWRFEPRCRP
jgi:hypothetical protein